MMSSVPPQEIHIIGGQFKRSKLKVPVLPGLRPTPARVRETLFNWLGQDLTGWRVLDAFAGSGALGLEAASRGATAVTMLEQHPQLVRQLQASVERLNAEQVRVHRADALLWLSQTAHTAKPVQFDLIFLDPPFDGDLFEPALQLAAQCLSAHGRIYLEAPHDWSTPSHDGQRVLPAGLTVLRHGRAGAVHYHLLSKP
jgi:16S rRNA (guanine966-N2)-methyltransferase